MMETLDSGKPIYDNTQGDIPDTAMTFRWHAEAIDKLEDSMTAGDGEHVSMVVRGPLGVVGAILVMAGALLTHAMSGRRPKASPTGFQALAARSKGPVGRREWKPPETAVKAPRCPSCGEELRPGWKACPNCGYALISEEREGKGSL